MAKNWRMSSFVLCYAQARNATPNFLLCAIIIIITVTIIVSIISVIIVIMRKTGKNMLDKFMLLC